MKNIFLSFLILISSLQVFGQNTEAQNLTIINIVRNNTLSPARVANALDALNYSKQGILQAYTASGTDTYTVTGPAAITAYASGQIVIVTFTNANTGAATLNINSIGAADLKDNEGNALSAGAIAAGATYIFKHNGTNFWMVGASGGGSGGVWGSITGTLSDQTDLQTALDAKEDLLETVSAATAGATITLDFDGDTQKIFVGDASFATGKAVAFSNATNGQVFSFHFEVTNVAGTLNFPANVQMFDEGWDVGTTTWTPPATGEYEIAGSYDGTNWRIKRIGPYDTTPTSGGGTPGGADTQVQYNDAGAFGGEADMAYNETTNTLTVDVVAVDTEVYDATGWNGDLSVPTKDAVRDKIEALTSGKYVQVAFSDQSSTITATAGKVTFRMPFAMTVTSVRASLKTGQTSGNIFTVDIHESGTTILSTKITIDNTEKTSTTAATAPVVSDTSLADDAEITVDVDQIGDGTAIGGLITIIGN